MVVFKIACPLPTAVACRHCGLLSSLEKSLVELGSTCSAATKKLGGRWEAARKLSAERQDALAAALERQAAAVEALSEGLSCAAAIAAGGGGAEAVRAAVAAAARRAAGERVDAFARERLREDDARWQVRQGRLYRALLAHCSWTC
jgi:hypothetical protein